MRGLPPWSLTHKLLLDRNAFSQPLPPSFLLSMPPGHPHTLHYHPLPQMCMRMLIEACTPHNQNETALQHLLFLASLLVCAMAACLLLFLACWVSAKGRSMGFLGLVLLGGLTLSAAAADQRGRKCDITWPLTLRSRARACWSAPRRPATGPEIQTGALSRRTSLSKLPMYNNANSHTRGRQKLAPLSARGLSFSWAAGRRNGAKRTSLHISVEKCAYFVVKGGGLTTKSHIFDLRADGNEMRNAHFGNKMRILASVRTGP